MIPRSMNSFILYRRNARGLVPRGEVKTASKYLGEGWKEESPRIKDHYARLSEAYAAVHRIFYPKYQYRPTPKPKDSKSIR
ncbi:MAG: hypothetical protein DHS80DRAFT_16081 [Piptocephalis tieghemiana]|nr:MAG: hypothetical protein DHS80DRAFT_16081 [Piptocephalis tieghemiana]